MSNTIHCKKFTLKEVVDLNALRIIRDNFEVIYRKTKLRLIDHKSYKYITDYKTLFTNINNFYKSKKRSNIVNYKHSGKYTYGRRFRIEHSLQECPRPIRHTIAKNIYYDLDIKNAHPLFTLQYCYSKGFDHPILKKYVEGDREAFLNSMIGLKIMKPEEVNGRVEFKRVELKTRDETKQYFLAILNGGGQEHPEHQELNDFYIKHKEFLNFFYLQEENSKYRERADKKITKGSYANPRGSCLNYYLCEVEDIVLSHIEKVLEENNVEYGTLCFDGLMVYKKSVKDLSSLLTQINSYLKKVMGYSIQVVNKEMDEAIDLTGLSIIDDIHPLDKVEIGKSIVYDCSNDRVSDVYHEYFGDDVFYTKCVDYIMYDDKTRLWRCEQPEDNLIKKLMVFLKDVVMAYKKDYVNNITDETDETKEHEKLISHTLKTVKTTGFVRGCIRPLNALILKEPSILDTFDTKYNLFCFNDGTCYDFETNTMRDIRKDDYVITTCGYNSPIRDKVYIEEALKILKSLTDDENHLKSMMSALSLSLYGRNKNELFLTLTGKGRNGKGVLSTWVQSVYGNYFVSIGSAQLTKYKKENTSANSELASCRWARMVMATEPEDVDENTVITLKSSSIKQWTGNDPITTRFLNKNSFTFTPRFTLYLQTNNIPKLSTDDFAMQQRMKVIPFNKTFVKDEGQPLLENEVYRDELLKEKIKENTFRDALFYILLDTYIENRGNFFESLEVKNSTKEYFEKQNEVKLWFMEHYDLCPKKCSCVKKSHPSTNELFNHYCVDNGSDISLREFGKKLNKFCEVVKTKDCNRVLCIKKIVEIKEDTDFGLCVGVPM